MDVFSGYFPALVFKASIEGDLGEFSLDSQMLRVLMALDGKKNLSSVSRFVNLNMGTLKEVLTRLHHFRLIEKVESAVPMLEKEFFDFITVQLLLAIGPIAEFLIEDEIRELGDDPTQIPLHRAAELVNLLARQIPREEKRVDFQQAMVRKIKEINR